MIDGRNFFDQPIKNDLKIYDNIKKIGSGKSDDHTTGCLLYYPCFKKYYKLITIDLSKQRNFTLIQKQINFTGILEREGSAMFFIIEEAKEIVLDFSKGTAKVLWFYFVLMTQYSTLNVKFI